MTQPAVLKINPDDIAVIDVLVGLEALLYVSKGTVVSLVSKNQGEIKRPNPGVIKITHPGFYQAREFYQPLYPLIDKNEQRSDFWTILLWKPANRTEGEAANIEFFRMFEGGIIRFGWKGSPEMVFLLWGVGA